MKKLATVLVVVAAVALGFAGGARLGGGATAGSVVQPTPAAPHTTMNVTEMDKMHEARVKAFPAHTRGLGAQPAVYKLVGGVKVFELVPSQVEWEVEPGIRREAFAYNGQIPGPIIRVTEGDRVRIVLKNKLPESTAIHWHGLQTPNKMDGVPFVTQPPVKPGQTFTYEFVAKPAGTHMYHAHHGVDQITKGLLGAFIVEPRDGRQEPKVSQDVVLIVNDGPLGYTLNGKGFPATAPIVVKRGQRIRIRYLNQGQLFHPMHLHGLSAALVARDGHPLAQPIPVDTVNVGPGERHDIVVTANEPGLWALHCHILSHAESSRGMHGMVTVVVVQ